MEYKRNETAMSGVKDDMTGSYWLHTLEPKYEYNLPDGSLTLTLPVEYMSYSYPARGIKTRKVMFSPMLDIDYKLGTMASIDASAGIVRNADTRSVPFNGAMMNNYRTYTLGTDSMSFSRTKTASIRLSWLNTATMLSWNVYAIWQQISQDRYFSYLYAGDLTLINPVWADNRHTSFSGVGNVKKIWRDARLTLKGSASYSYNKALASQNSVEGYIRYNAANVQVGASWDKFSWLTANLTIAGNITWKRPDAFSETDNVLKNAYCSLSLDFTPIKALRLYADAAGTTYEITHDQYSTNLFLNAGAKYDFSKTLSITLTTINLLNRESYEISSYQGSNYRFLRVPLRGRMVMAGINFKF